MIAFALIVPILFVTNLSNGEPKPAAAGHHSIPYFRVPEDTLSGEVVLSGKIMDAKTKEPISAELDLYFDTDLVKADVLIVNDGQYRETLSKPGWYLIEITAPGYLAVSDTLWLLDNKREDIQKDYYLSPLEVGLNVVLPNIYFHFGEAILTEASFPQLDKLLKLIHENPHLTFEIAGHTDDEGSEAYNLQLSQNRAQAVVDYLVDRGVNPESLIAKGYGESKPIHPNYTKEGKAKNRRVEFTVVHRE